MLKLLTADGTEYRIKKKEMRVGRSAHNDITLRDDKGISRVHFVTRFQQGRYILQDANSTNGTYVNGRRVRGITTLRHGDRIELSNTRLWVEDEEVGESVMARVQAEGRQRQAALADHQNAPQPYAPLPGVNVSGSSAAIQQRAPSPPPRLPSSLTESKLRRSLRRSRPLPVDRHKLGYAGLGLGLLSVVSSLPSLIFPRYGWICLSVATLLSVAGFITSLLGMDDMRSRTTSIGGLISSSLGFILIFVTLLVVLGTLSG